MGKPIEGCSFENIPSYDRVVWIKGEMIRCDLLKANELRLLLVILGLKGVDQIFIKQEYMALRMGGCSTDKIGRLLDSLCKLNLLSIKSRRTTKGKFSSNIYVLADLDKWLKQKGRYNRSRTELYQPFVYSDFITDNDLRLFAVIKSLEGYEHITLAISQLVKYTNLSKPVLLNTRKSLIEKGLISYERRGDVLKGNQMNEYFWNDEREWIEKQYIEEQIEINEEQ